MTKDQILGLFVCAKVCSAYVWQPVLDTGWALHSRMTFAPECFLFVFSLPLNFTHLHQEKSCHREVIKFNSMMQRCATTLSISHVHICSTMHQQAKHVDIAALGCQMHWGVTWIRQKVMMETCQCICFNGKLQTFRTAHHPHVTIMVDWVWIYVNSTLYKIHA